MKQNKQEQIRKQFREVISGMDITELTHGVDELWSIFNEAYKLGIAQSRQEAVEEERGYCIRLLRELKYDFSKMTPSAFSMKKHDYNESLEKVIEVLLEEKHD